MEDWIQVIRFRQLLTLLTNINKCQLEGLYIENTCFDINCVVQLAQVVTYNKTMDYLRLTSSPLLQDTYQLLTGYLFNRNIACCTYC